MRKPGSNKKVRPRPTMRSGDWWALVRSPQSLPVLFASETAALEHRDPDEYVVRVAVKRASRGTLDVRQVLRTEIAKRLVHDFLAGASLRTLARDHGLSYEGIQRLIRTHVR